MKVDESPGDRPFLPLIALAAAIVAIVAASPYIVEFLGYIILIYV